MTYPRATLRRWQFITFIILAVGAISLYLLRVPWEENIRILLGYHEEISRCFLIVSCALILFRLIAFFKTGVPAETRKLRFGFGPVFDLMLDPLLDYSLFYSAWFILSTIFQERMHQLSIDSFFILLSLVVVLMYMSIHDLIRLFRETFYVQRTERVIPQ